MATRRMAGIVGRRTPGRARTEGVVVAARAAATTEAGTAAGRKSRKKMGIPLLGVNLIRDAISLVEVEGKKRARAKLVVRAAAAKRDGRAALGLISMIGPGSLRAAVGGRRHRHDAGADRHAAVGGEGEDVRALEEAGSRPKGVCL